MTESVSPFYPPRSRWYNSPRYFCPNFLRRFRGFWEISFGHIVIGPIASVLSFLIPGYVFWACGYRNLGKVAMGLVTLFGLVFFIWLGQPTATIAYTSILSLHVISIAFLLKRLVPDLHFAVRLLFTFIVLFVLDFLVYGFLQRKIEQSFVPLRIGKNVVVVHNQPIKYLNRNEWIAYRIKGSFYGPIIAEQGFGLERVMAGPGDVVRFGKDTFTVNNQSFAKKPFMPSGGELVLSQQQWLVWPEFVMRGGGMPQNEIASFLKGYAVISDKQIVGKPFVRWFWRKQILL